MIVDTIKRKAATDGTNQCGPDAAPTQPALNIGATTHDNIATKIKLNKIEDEIRSVYAHIQLAAMNLQAA